VNIFDIVKKAKFVAKKAKFVAKQDATPAAKFSDTPMFCVQTFHAMPDLYRDRYAVGDAIVTITDDFQYLVFEPQFKNESDKLAYDKIMQYKQLLKEDVNSLTEEQLMISITAAAADLGLSNVLTDNYKTVRYFAKRDIFGYEILDVMMKDSAHIEDITCSDPTSVGVIHRDYLESEVLRSNVHFRNSEHLNVFLERIARLGGKHISSSDPMLDFQLEDKFRVAIISDEIISPKSAAFSIRIKSDKPFTITEMIEKNVIPTSVVSVIWKMLDFRGTGLVVGATGAGKSSLLNTLFPLLHRSSKIMTIEDTAELQIPQFDWTPLIIDAPITSPQYHDKFQELLNAVLRHRPKMVSVGEVRGKSTKKLFDVMSTGHSSLSSFHAFSAEGAMRKIISEYDVHPASFSHLWFILTVATIIDKDKRHKRKCVSFDEVCYDGVQASLVNLCSYDALSDSFLGAIFAEMISKSKKLDYLTRFDASSDLASDLKRRASLLDECVRQKAYTPKKVMGILSRYYAK